MDCSDQARAKALIHAKLLNDMHLASVMAYGDKKANKSYGDCGISDSDLRRICSKSGANSALVAVVECSDGKFRIIVAFRGTLTDFDPEHINFLKSATNVLQDIQFVQVPMSFEALNHDPASSKDRPTQLPGAAVHSGFLNALRSIYPNVIDAIRELLQQDASNNICRDRIIVTGHSLGGAMAKLLTFSLLEHQENIKLAFQKNFQVACVTFGEPHPGNRAFAQKLDNYEKTGRLISFRVTNFLDPVPRLLSVTGNYDHSGTHICLDDLWLEKAFESSEVFANATDPRNFFEAAMSCVESTVGYHGIDTVYANNLRFYLAPNGNLRYVRVMARILKKQKAPLREFATRLISDSAVSSESASHVSSKIASSVSNLSSCANVLNTILGAVNVAATFYNISLTKQMHLAMDAGFREVGKANKENLKAIQECHKQLASEIKRSRQEMKDLHKDKVMLDVRVFRQILSSLGQRLARNNDEVNEQNFEQNAIETQRIIDTVCVILTQTNTVTQQISVADSFELMACALEAVFANYHVRKRGKKIASFDSFRQICFSRNGLCDPLFTIIGKRLLPLRNNPDHADKVQQLSENASSMLWNVMRDAEMSVAVSANTAPMQVFHPAALYIFSIFVAIFPAVSYLFDFGMEGTLSFVFGIALIAMAFSRELFSTHRPRQQSAIYRPRQQSAISGLALVPTGPTVEIVAASALVSSPENKKKWIESSQHALLSALGDLPEDICHNMKFAIVALDMEQGLAMIQEEAVCALKLEDITLAHKLHDVVDLKMIEEEAIRHSEEAIRHSNADDIATAGRMLEFLDPRAGHHEPPKFPKARLHLAECMLKKASNTEDYDECIQLLQSIINIEGFEKSDYVVKARLLHQAKARKAWFARPVGSIPKVIGNGAGLVSNETFNQFGLTVQFPETDLPCSLALDCDGNVVVSEYLKHHIKVLHRNDCRLLKCFGKYGAGNCQFDSPWGVALDSAGHLVVADSRNYRVQVLKYEDGSHIRTFGSQGRDNGQFTGLSGVAIDVDGNIVVRDTHDIAGRIQIFRMQDGTHIRSIACGPGEGGVAFDSEGNLVVPEYGFNHPHRIQVLRYSDGALLRTIGHQGKKLFGDGDGEFCEPRGVALDGAGHLVVVERGNHRVQVLKYADGSHVRFIGGSKNKMGVQFDSPAGGVAIDSNGRIIVCDTRNHRMGCL